MLNWFNLSLQLNRFPITSAQRELQETQAIPKSDFPEYIEQKKREIVVYHIQHNSFYSERFGKTRFQNWEELPILQKMICNVHFPKD